jgi:folate-binding protein YgfZ
VTVDERIEVDAQYRELREGAGFLRREDRALLAVRGPDAAEYLQGQLTNDVEALAPGEGCYAALLDRKGHMQADMRVLRVADDAEANAGTSAEADEIWVEVERVALPAARSHLEMYKVGREVEVADRSDELATVSAIGPAASELAEIGPLGPEHAHREIELVGIRCRAVASDLGVDLICAAGDATTICGALAEAGLARVDEAAAEIVRVESGRPRYGAEMGPETIPAEAGIVERAVSFEKGCYIGQETVARLHYKGRPNRHLRGLRLSAPTEAGATLHFGEKEVGRIGAACVSPALGPIALAIVRREAGPGDKLVAGDGINAEVVELPFA